MFKKTAVAALAAICALCGMAFTACGTTPPEAAEEEKWFEPERYTATDYLLDAEGNPSDTSIFDLAERVNAAQAGDEIPDLSSAIPLLQLPHKYVGREYGYAVEKDGDIFSVMLFDIDFDCSKTRRGELTLTVLFNRRFRREVKDGRYTWFAAEGQSVLKLANPRFSAMITYEHSPVAGTYLPESFTDDEMLHIYQSWVKYDGAEYLERGEPRKYFAGSALVAACAENAEYIAMGYDEASARVREQQNRREKKRIGELGAGLVVPSSSLFLDSSSTAGAMIPYLSGKAGLTAITNGLRNALLLAEDPEIRVVIACGTVRPNTGSLYGADTLDYLSRLRPDYCFISCGGLTETGITESTLEQGAIKRQMLACSGRKVLLCDSSKFGAVCLYEICPLSGIDTLVTDAPPPVPIAEALKTAGVKVLLAAEKEA